MSTVSSSLLRCSCNFQSGQSNANLPRLRYQTGTAIYRHFQAGNRADSFHHSQRTKGGISLPVRLWGAICSKHGLFSDGGSEWAVRGRGPADFRPFGLCFLVCGYRLVRHSHINSAQASYCSLRSSSSSISSVCM